MVILIFCKKFVQNRSAATHELLKCGISDGITEEE